MSRSPLGSIIENKNCLQESLSRLRQQRCTLHAVEQNISYLTPVQYVMKHPHVKIMVFSSYLFNSGKVSCKMQS